MSRTRLTHATLGGVLAALLVAGTSPATPAAPPDERQVVAGSSGQDAWKRPVRLVRRTRLVDAAAASTDAVAAVAWVNPGVVKARLRAPGEGWRPPVKLADGARSGSLDISVNARGDMAVTWLKDLRDESRLRVSRRPAGGQWSRPVTLFQGTPAFGTDDPQVSVGPRGKVTVALSIGRRGSPSWRPRVFTLADGHWTRPQTLTKRFGSGVQVATGPEGRVTTAWTAGDGGRCVAHGSGLSWSRPTCWEKPRNSLELELAVDDAGRVYLATTDRVWSAAPGTRWHREPVPGGDLNGFGDSGETLSIDASSPGRAVVAWSQGEQVGRSEINWTTFASVRRTDGTWTPRAHLTNRPAPSAAIAGDGTAYVAWAGRASIRVAHKPPTERWSDPPALIPSKQPGSPVLGVNRTGSALVVFQRFYTRSSLWAAWRP